MSEREDGRYVSFLDRVYFFPASGGLKSVTDNNGQPITPAAFQTLLDETESEQDGSMLSTPTS